MQKKCSHCRKIKDASEFRRNKKTDDGYSIWCKECKKKYPQEYSEEYYRQHREWNQERSKIYYQEHRESILEKSHLNRGKRRKYWKKYYAENREWILTQDKKRRKRDKEKIRIRTKRYNETHKEELQKKRHERYLRIRHIPEYKLKKRVHDLCYRARLENCEVNDLTAKQVKLLFEKTTHCPICGERFLKDDKRALDHIVPLSKGGNNTLLNTQITHFSCNSSKGNRHYANYGDGQLLLIPKFQESPFKKPEPIVVTEKKCNKCQTIKPIEMFPENKKRRDGHIGTCRRCMQIYGEKYSKEYRKKRKKYLAEHPEEYFEQLEKQRQWRKEKVEQDPDYYKKLYYKDLEVNRARARKHCAKHREYYREYAREYYSENTAHLQEYGREYYSKNREKQLIYAKLWREAHPDYMKNYYQTHKA